MITRYSRPQMAALFSPEARLATWLDIELAVAEAMADLDLVDRTVVARLVERAALERERIIDPARVEEIERTTRHDVIAFLTHIEEVCGVDARVLHLGMTSSDLLDTALAVQLVRAIDALVADMDELLAVLERRAFEHKHTVCMGRSHGIHAEPTTFGLKLAGFYAEAVRNRSRLQQARAEIATCKISGAVGTYANIDPRVESMVARRFGLVPETISTQVVPRDRHAVVHAALAVLASGIERLAVEIRHLQRTEVGEVEEHFAAGQKGSSAMPHKRNPILSENLTGLARMMRAALQPALENIVLWHERDISHSSVERVMLPDAFILADFALARLTALVDGLVIHADRMRANVELTHGLVFSQRVLLALTERGLPRQRAYELVQRHAMRALDEKKPLLELLREDPEVVGRIGPERLEALFDLGWHTRYVDTIFERVFGHR